MSEINLWEKYRNESKQTICVIGVLILAAKLCVADNHFSLDEEEEILKIIPHEPHQKRILMKILEESAEDKNSVRFHAERIKKLIGNDHQDFLEFIIAVLYRLAHSDHVYHDEEDKLIREVAQIFGVEKTYFDLFKEITVKIFKYKYFKKQNA